ncbi:hypothetical protein F7725_013660 [Dissostichus mawsoni]|uniref:Uncharacterized protein n=1 Tax=Dissostichus mawsoni TaxID=36200 RepID=A0A7J5YTP9_DISMA|nr:hypothetical protein F7725_013660 [Dissostichus mawsoni]
MDSLTFWLNLSLVAPRGLVDGPVPFGSDTQYPNVKTGRSTADGPVPYERAFHYTNADPTKDSQSGNPGSIPSGVVPEVISYGYGGYPLGNMDVAESNTTASGRVDGPVPYGGATRHTNANPVKKDIKKRNIDFSASCLNLSLVSGQSGNLGSIPSGVAPEVISYGYGFYPFGNMAISLEACLYCLTLSLVADRNTAASGRVDGPVPFGGDTRYANAKPLSINGKSSNI